MRVEFVSLVHRFLTARIKLRFRRSAPGVNTLLCLVLSCQPLLASPTDSTTASTAESATTVPAEQTPQTQPEPAQATEPLPAKEDESTRESNQHTLVHDTLTQSVRELFLEKETPFLKIRWGGKIFVDAPLGNEPQGAELTLRKAELKISKRFGKNLQAVATGKYAKGQFAADDSYLIYSGWKTILVTLGIQDPPFSLEAMNSSSAVTFMENALPVAALAENKNAGLDFLKRTSSSILNASLVFYNPRQDGVSETGTALVARYVYSPIKSHGGDNLHLGGSLSYRLLDDGADVQFRSRPEVATADVFYIDTGDMYDGKEVLRIGLEASQVKGRFSWQTEVLSSNLTRSSADSLHFWGAYVHFSQFLTNDSRNYDQGTGEFIPLRPNSPLGKNGWGAFELAFRASYTDLTNKDIIGGEESNLSLGLNWYLNDKLRIMANLIKVLDVDRPGSEYDGLDPLIFALRGQWLIY